MSVWAEFGDMLEQLLGRPISVQYGGWRTGDQRVSISDIPRAERELDWHPRIDVREGVSRLFVWARDHPELLAE